MLIRKLFHTDLYIVFTLQAVLQHLKLQHANHSYDNFFHPRVKFLEDLDCSLLGDLADSLHKLLTLHRIYLAYSGKMLRSKSWDPFKFYRCLSFIQRISNRENTRVKNTDNISGIGLLHMLSLLGHHLLRLGKTDLLPTLHMHYFHTSFKLAGTDSHKCNTVSVRLIHIRLDFKYKS